VEVCFHRCYFCRKDFEHTVPSGSPLDYFWQFCFDCAWKQASQINQAGRNVCLPKNSSWQKESSGETGGPTRWTCYPSQTSHAIFEDGQMEHSFNLALSTELEKQEVFALLSGDY
jgi:hypothetical protein